MKVAAKCLPRTVPNTEPMLRFQIEGMPAATMTYARADALRVGLCMALHRFGEVHAGEIENADLWTQIRERFAGELDLKTDIAWKAEAVDDVGIVTGYSVLDDYLLLQMPEFGCETAWLDMVDTLVALRALHVALDQMEKP